MYHHILCCCKVFEMHHTYSAIDASKLWSQSNQTGWQMFGNKHLQYACSAWIDFLKANIYWWHNKEQYNTSMSVFTFFHIKMSRMLLIQCLAALSLRFHVVICKHIRGLLRTLVICTVSFHIVEMELVQLHLEKWLVSTTGQWKPSDRKLMTVGFSADQPTGALRMNKVCLHGHLLLTRK